MKVTILGTGIVGITLAKGFIAKGHSVVFGTRDPQGEKAVAALAQAPGARAASHAEAAREGDIAVVALPWSGVREGLALTGAANLAGKLVMDATNPLDFSTGAPRMAIGHTDSAGETVQRLLPDAKVVKVFNTAGNALMVNPHFEGAAPTMFIAGNDAAAKQQVDAILKEFGWTGGVDLGGIESSRYLEPLAMVWIVYGVTRNHWTHALALLGAQ